MALTLSRENSWRVAKKNENEYLYQVERAKSGRARCRRCSDFIAKDELRFAIPIRDPRGEFGYIAAWQHVACTRVDATDDLDEKIAGLSALSREDSSKVLSQVTSSEKPEHLQELNPDDLVKRGPLEPLKAPDAILQHLLPFQEEGLRWLVEQELIDVDAQYEEEVAKRKAEEEADAKAGKKRNMFQLERIPTRPCKGGILADEMGMGKTIQMISLIVRNRGTGPTLVVCPVSSMMQWQEEISTNVRHGELQVLVYHKTAQYTKEQLEVADVVLTTYPVLERAWRILVNEAKLPCQYCGQLYLPKRLIVHNKYYCGPDAKRTAKLMKREKDSHKSSGQRNNKVQSKETIRKGLKTLHVDVSDGDDDDSDSDDVPFAKKAAKKTKKGAAAKKGAKKPTPKKGAKAKASTPTTKGSKPAAAASASAKKKVTVKGKKGAATAASKAATVAAKGKKRVAAAKTGSRRAAPPSSDDDDDDESSEWEEWHDSVDDDSDVEVVVPPKAAASKGKKGAAATKAKPAPKKAAAGRDAKKKPAPKRGGRKSKADDSDADDESAGTSAADSDDDETAAAGGAEKRGVVGPMGMYRELMQEAGRRARSRWEKARTAGSSDDDDDDDDDSPTTSEGTDDSDYDSSDDDSNSSDSAASDSSSDARQGNKKGNPLFCRDCGMPLKDHEYCPETGEQHPEPELRPIPDENVDLGADEVDAMRSVLHSIKWFRVVLDEAHRIKGRTTSTARSAYALVADRKWCITGTPLQNRVGDLYSLLRFMRLTPYARYYCQVPGCKCSTLSHPFSGESSQWCVHCGHGPLQHYSYFNKHIMNPIVRYGYVGDGRKSLMLLSGDVLSRCMLRRTKQERAADINLPPCEISVVEVTLTDAERDFYTSLYKKSASRFDTFVDKGTLLHNYAHIFQLLSRLRQALDHPYLVLFSDSAYAAAAAASVSAIAAEASAKNDKPADAGGKKPAAAARKKTAGNTPTGKAKAEPAVKVKEEEQTADAAPAAAGSKPKRSRSGKAPAAATTKTDVKPEAAGDGSFDVKPTPDEQSDAALAAAATLGVSLADLPAAAVDPSDVCHLCCESTCSRSKFVVEPCKHAFHRLCLLEYLEARPELQGEQQPQPAAKATKKSGESADGAAGKGAAKGKNKVAAAASPAAPKCPRCFVPMAIDLRRLQHVMDDDTESTGDDNEGDESPDGKKKKKKKAGGRKPAPKKAARSEAAKTDDAPAPLIAPARPDDDDDDGDEAFFFNANPAKPDDDHADDANATVQASSPAKGSGTAAPAAKGEFRAGSIMNRIDTSKFVMGTKLQAIVAHVKDTVPADEKVIVFSQFGAMLDLVEYALEHHGIRTVKLMGHMPLSQRQAMLHAFRTEPAVKAILISLKAGGEGLNLQCANHVVLIDPWWNPAVEMQAVQRAHRIGQRKPVKAVRFVTKDSVEERMMGLQDKKLLVFQGTVDGSADSLQRLSEEDLRFLFTR